MKQTLDKGGLMTTAVAIEAQRERKANAIETTVFHDQSSCSRCGGLLARKVCMDLFNPTGELEVNARRCVQCGAIVDPVILANRALLASTPPFAFRLQTPRVIS